MKWNSLKAQALAAGATWDIQRQTWRMTLAAAQLLGLDHALLEKHPPMDIKNDNF